MRVSNRVIAAVSVCLWLTACGVTPDSEDPAVAYREAESVESLEVPPDLTRPRSSAGLDVGSDFGVADADADADADAAEGGLLPEYDGVRFVRAGASAWVEIDDTSPDAVWPRIEGFLRSQGLEVERSEPALGIVETRWAERYDDPESGGLTGLFASIFGTDGSEIRDRYQLRLERLPADSGTRVFVVHRSARETATGVDPKRSQDYDWERAGGDPAIEAEMLSRLLIYLGASEQRAGDIVADNDPAADLSATLGGAVHYVENDAGAAWLAVDDRNRRRVFARTGDALVDLGAELGDSDPAEGMHSLRWAPPESDAPEAFEIHVRSDDGATRITAADERGRPQSGSNAKALLRELTAAMGGDAEDVRQPESGSDDDGGEPIEFGTTRPPGGP